MKTSLHGTSRALVFSASALLITAGCSVSAEAPPPAAHAVQTCRQEVHALLLPDVTISMSEGGADPPNEANLQTAAAVVDRCGGSVALGIITYNGQQRLVRLALRADTTLEPKKEPSQTPFDYIETKIAWEKRRAARQEKIDAFVTEAMAVLSQSANHTDLWDNLARGVTFLLEPSATHRKRIAILITDAVSNVDSPQFDLAAVADSATWIVVHGTRDIGPLKALKPERFENTTASFEYLQDLATR